MISSVFLVVFLGNSCLCAILDKGNPLIEATEGIEPKMEREGVLEETIQIYQPKENAGTEDQDSQTVNELPSKTVDSTLVQEDEAKETSNGHDVSEAVIDDHIRKEYPDISDSERNVLKSLLKEKLKSSNFEDWLKEQENLFKKAPFKPEKKPEKTDDCDDEDTIDRFKVPSHKFQDHKQQSFDTEPSDMSSFTTGNFLRNDLPYLTEMFEEFYKTQQMVHETLHSLKERIYSLEYNMGNVRNILQRGQTFGRQAYHPAFHRNILYSPWRGQRALERKLPYGKLEAESFVPKGDETIVETELKNRRKVQDLKSLDKLTKMDKFQGRLFIGHLIPDKEKFGVHPTPEEIKLAEDEIQHIIEKIALNGDFEDLIKKISGIPPSCPYNIESLQIGDHCYNLFTKAMNFQKAKRYCQIRNGTLLNEAVNEDLWHQLTEAFPLFEHEKIFIQKPESADGRSGDVSNVLGKSESLYYYHTPPPIEKNCLAIDQKRELQIIPVSCEEKLYLICQYEYKQFSGH